MADHSGADDDRGSLSDDFRALVHSITLYPKGPWEGFRARGEG